MAYEPPPDGSARFCRRRLRRGPRAQMDEDLDRFAEVAERMPFARVTQTRRDQFSLRTIFKA